MTWIKTKERPPEDGQEILAYGTSTYVPQFDRIYLAGYCNGEFGIIPCGSFIDTPEYWAPSPLPPLNRSEPL